MRKWQQHRGRCRAGAPDGPGGVLTPDLAANHRQLAHLLHWPENIGIMFRPLRIGIGPPAAALLVWIDGLTAEDALLHGVIAPLAGYRGEASLEAVAGAIALPGWERERFLSRLLQRVLDGCAALLADGWAEALVLHTAAYTHHHAGTGLDPNQDVFAREMAVNVALIRKRLRDPNLLAVRVPIPHARGEAALVYLADRAPPALVRLVRCWARRHLGEESAGRGLLNATSAVLGLLPRFEFIRHPDKAAILLDSGAVVLLPDRGSAAHAAPVTAAGWLTSPGDFGWPYPFRRWLIRVRLLLYLWILLTPGGLVALFNYHTDMVPTAFMTAVASVRENAPFSLVFEVMVLELLVELTREAAFRLPGGLTVGAATTVMLLIGLLGVHSGLFGPLPALTAVVGFLASLALPGYGPAYFLRTWRFYLLVAAVMFGFFGVAAALSVFLAYLCLARSWGMPFLGPAGGDFTAPERNVRRPRGGRR